ncbi:hypothetical protein JKP75_13340 [Blastococcus sp. TML/M2B]|uniref:hypothetical protein n=1 Tax=unclassified Blastococcus TaxID=2619396 RepID=UPI00190CBB90|nr:MULTISPECIES: hypothetical protein [unclassified Blastococcus]MBN1093461.1 hypothetical protein [Blastococcus sp. TML/M2B]MBN1096423.1 hypothetical protein [Blastococcus sp. TML/C7B]
MATLLARGAVPARGDRARDRGGGRPSGARRRPVRRAGATSSRISGSAAVAVVSAVAAVAAAAVAVAAVSVTRLRLRSAEIA